MPVLAASVRSIPEAVDALRELYARQLEKANERQTPPNASVDGDGAARTSFLTLLPPEEQRAFFLQTVQNRAFWPRVRTLFGAPPYSFLRPEDAGVLRAAGIATGRLHMAHEETTATNYSEFGEGHFTDRAGRLYRVIAKQRAHSRSELPWQGLRASGRVVMDVRIQKMSHAKKTKVIRGEEGPLAQMSIVFPRVGDTIRLRTVSALAQAQQSASSHDASDASSEEDDLELSARVSMGRQKDRNSPVARLVVDVV